MIQFIRYDFGSLFAFSDNWMRCCIHGLVSLVLICHRWHFFLVLKITQLLGSLFASDKVWNVSWESSDAFHIFLGILFVFTRSYVLLNFLDMLMLRECICW